MSTNFITRGLNKVFGSRNDRLLKRYTHRVDAINQREPEIRALTDAELRARTVEFRQRIADGTPIDSFLPEVFATAREVMDRAVGIRNVFNPEHGFDPARLPGDAQKLYEQAKAEIDRREPEDVPGGEPAAPWMQVELPNRLYEAVRELYPQSRPPFRARPFDVQLIGGMVLANGRIAEMKTGEGKTIVAPLACYAACIENLKCHVVTVNDYLVQRDRDWVFPFYYWLGLHVGAIHPMHMQPPEQKKRAYDCDVLYGTNSELGFDYLRDNMKLSTDDQVQKRRDFCIVDEIDSILIDEARTPLIISGPAHDDAPRYGLADGVARHLIEMQKDWDAANAKAQKVEMQIKALEGDIRNARDKAKIPEMRKEMERLQKEELPRLEQARDEHIQYYEVEPEKKASHLTHEGVAEAQKKAGIGSFYVGNNVDFPHLLENALRAHAIYKRDKEYVVRDGEVIIVDEFTGRLMVGRQWSDGLHQAVESKEGVKIKQETQTLATVTIQNFFKLYDRLAGMTGTAVTEATEFGEIYDLEVVVIPTNRPIARHDRDDLIFLSEKDKWEAILDEIMRVHDTGRPVLVGTTSVEKSEMLSQMLTRKHGIQHEVLNAKQHEREANIVEDAGRLGAVMIATNMAGRGTDIKLRPIPREDLVRHWQLRNILPKDARPEMGDDELIAMAYRHMAVTRLGIKKKEAADLSDDDLKLRLLRHWCEQDAWVEADKAQTMSMDECLDALDKLPDYQRHRLRVYTHAEGMGGLHIVGTERHEARRIDNQLRGRSGRQGDNGSSRFFISLEDDLMKMFAGKATMTALSKLGMKEGDAIEHRWVTKSVGRAQRKVEERNYEIRKNLLEYDEVMEHQRNAFYGTRQSVLEGDDIRDLIFNYIADSIADAVNTYLDPGYVPSQVAEWARQQLDVSVDPAKLHLDDVAELEHTIRQAAAREVEEVIAVSLGEYMSDDLPPDEWDLRGLQSWAMSRFSVDLKQNRLRQSNPREVQDELTAAAREQIEKKQLDGLAKFLDPLLAHKELAGWVRNKFGFEVEPQQFAELPPEEVGDKLLTQAREAYRQREIRYPVQFIMDVAAQGLQQGEEGTRWAIQQLLDWANTKYELGWTGADLDGKSGQDIADALSEAAEDWLFGGKLEAQASEKAAEHRSDPKALARWLRDRFGVEVTPDEVEQARAGGGDGEAAGIEAFIVDKGRSALRSELTRLEQFVLLQILDQAWKDHLYGMDQLKDAIGLRGYAEKDPRIEYKREGAANFRTMQSTVRDRVTELIFRARLTPNVQVRSAYGDTQEARHDQPQGTGVAASGGGGRQPAAAAAQQGTAEQQADLEAAEQAGSRGPRPQTRKQRRAAEARARKSGGGSPYKSRKKRTR